MRRTPEKRTARHGTACPPSRGLGVRGAQPERALRGIPGRRLTREEKGLRLASAAIMPAVTSGNINAPSMMIGDRCGRLILGLG